MSLCARALSLLLPRAARAVRYHHHPLPQSRAVPRHPRMTTAAQRAPATYVQFGKLGNYNFVKFEGSELAVF